MPTSKIHSSSNLLLHFGLVSPSFGGNHTSHTPGASNCCFPGLGFSPTFDCCWVLICWSHIPIPFSSTNTTYNSVCLLVESFTQFAFSTCHWVVPPKLLPTLVFSLGPRHTPSHLLLIPPNLGNPLSTFSTVLSADTGLSLQPIQYPLCATLGLLSNWTDPLFPGPFFFLRVPISTFLHLHFHQVDSLSHCHIETHPCIGCP